MVFIYPNSHTSSSNEVVAEIKVSGEGITHPKAAAKEAASVGSEGRGPKVEVVVVVVFFGLRIKIHVTPKALGRLGMTTLRSAGR